ncbi:hypothetical protein CABS03_14316 [Colletotrichum abscissum]
MPPTSRGQIYPYTAPVKRIHTLESIQKQWEIEAKYEQFKAQERNTVNTHIKLLAQWLVKSVNATLYEHAFQKATEDGAKFSIQRIVRHLKQELAPSEAVVRNAVREEYRQALNKARTGINPQRWYEEWQSAYLRAKTYDIPEISGEIAVLDFLVAVKSRLNPTWGQRTYETFSESMAFGTRTRTLEEIAYAFSLVTQDAHTKRPSGQGGAYSTFAGRSDSVDDANDKGDVTCPCNRAHPWRPSACRKLEWALTSRNASGSPMRMSKSHVEEVLAAVKSSKWKSLHGELKKAGWLRNDGTPKKPGFPKGSSNQPTASSSADQDEGHVVAVLMKSQDSEVNAIFSTPMGGAHPLSQSTVMDSCGAMHLVNDKSLLEPESCVLSGDDDYVESGTTTLPVTARGTRIMKGVLDGPKGKGTCDLKLQNVAYVEGFHVNIVSETLLNRSALWYCGLDCTLRQGTLHKSTVKKQLIRKNNLVFLEYKLLQSYPSSANLKRVLQSPAGIMLPVSRGKFRRSYQRTRERSDSALLWHLRTGHLGPNALRRLLYKTRASDEYSGQLRGFPLRTKTEEEVLFALQSLEAAIRRQKGTPICFFRSDNETALLTANVRRAYETWCGELGIGIELPPPHTKEPVGNAERAGQLAIAKALRALGEVDLDFGNASTQDNSVVEDSITVGFSTVQDAEQPTDVLQGAVNEADEADIVLPSLPTPEMTPLRELGGGGEEGDAATGTLEHAADEVPIARKQFLTLKSTSAGNPHNKPLLLHKNRAHKNRLIECQVKLRQVPDVQTGPADLHNASTAASSRRSYIRTQKTAITTTAAGTAFSLPSCLISRKP